MKKISLTYLLVFSAMFSYAMGANTLKYVPITVGDGLITFIPVTPPIIVLKGQTTVNLVVGDTYNDAGVDTVANVDIKQIITNGTVDTFKPGAYTIRYLAEDTSGNTSEITRIVVVRSLDEILPHDTNSYYAPYNERDFLYFADPQPSENGKNRVVRVNYEAMQFNEDNDSIALTEDAYLLAGETHSNPHSVDRAGKTNRFYVRTQNAYSFDVIAVENGKLNYVKTVPLSVNINGTEIKYSPRAFGAYNAKYDIQLVSGRNTSARYSMIGIVDVKTDAVIKHISRPIVGDGSATTGHAKWLDRDHFAVTDRGNHTINVYKVFKNSAGNIDVLFTSSLDTVGPVHALERVTDPKNSVDLNTFYAMGESVHLVTHPFVKKLLFNPQTGVLSVASVSNTLSSPSAVSEFIYTSYAELLQKKIPATTHHMNITPDGRHLLVPVYDGKIYKIDRVSMVVEPIVIDTGVEKGLGAGHIEFSKSLNIAIVTNHWSPYITIIDISNNGFVLKGYAKIYRDNQHDVYNPNEKHLMQPHFAHMSKDGKYFYTFASQDNGRFVKIDLEKLLELSVDTQKVYQFNNNDDNTEVMKTIDVEGAPEQAHS